MIVLLLLLVPGMASAMGPAPGCAPVGDKCNSAEEGCCALLVCDGSGGGARCQEPPGPTATPTATPTPGTPTPTPTPTSTPGGGGDTAGDCVPTGNGPPVPVITFATSEIDVCNGSAGDCRDVADQVRNLMQDWACQRTTEYVSRLTSDVVRMSTSWGYMVGQQEVTNNINDEWKGYEQPTGFLAMDLTVFDAEISIDGDNATLYYLVGMEAGFRWHYVQTGLFY